MPADFSGLETHSRFINQGSAKPYCEIYQLTRLRNPTG